MISYSTNETVIVSVFGKNKVASNNRKTKNSKGLFILLQLKMVE